MKYKQSKRAYSNTVVCTTAPNAGCLQPLICRLADQTPTPEVNTASQYDVYPMSNRAAEMNTQALARFATIRVMQTKNGRYYGYHVSMASTNSNVLQRGLYYCWKQKSGHLRVLSSVFECGAQLLPRMWHIRVCKVLSDGRRLLRSRCNMWYGASGGGAGADREQHEIMTRYSLLGNIIINNGILIQYASDRTYICLYDIRYYVTMQNICAWGQSLLCGCVHGWTQ